MRYAIAIAILVSLVPFCRSSAADPPRQWANAAERILNDPNFIFDREAQEEAVWFDVKQKAKDDAEKKRRAVKQQAKLHPGRAVDANGPKPIIVKSRKRYNHPPRYNPMAAYMAAQHRQGWMLANTPRTYTFPPFIKR